jgi:hypothetical protein
VAESEPWNPSKRTRILIGLLTLWPPIYLALFMASIGFSFFLFGNTSHNKPNVDVFKYIFPLHCFTMLQDTRVLIILFMGNMLAFPVYWWLYLRPGSERT